MLRCEARCDLQAFQHNISAVKSRVGKSSQIIAMLKSNAYGHGMLPLAKALGDQVDMIGVASFYEAESLRQAGIEKDILVMRGASTLTELECARLMNFQIVVHSEDQIRLLSQFNSGSSFMVWHKWDTGMNRLGCLMEDALDQLQALQAMPHVQVQGVMTHLAVAQDKRVTAKQLQSWQDHLKKINLPYSVANSALIVVSPECVGDWVRPGIMLYGVSPLPERIGSEFGLKPVMQFRAPVIAIKRVAAGSRVGYGGIHTCDVDTRVAVLAVGYGDGYPRLQHAGAKVYLNGVSCSVIGQVSMDLMTIALPETLPVELGDWAECWGPRIPVEEVARYAGTIAYELLARLTERVPRYYE